MGKGYLQRRHRHNDLKYRGHRDVGVAPPPTIMQVRPVAKKHLVKGAVVWARVPFFDGSGEKTRPAVVEERLGRTVVVRPVTTSERRRRVGAHEIADLAAAGLGRACAVALGRIEVDLIDIHQVVGALAPVDAVRVFGGEMIDLLEGA